MRGLEMSNHLNVPDTIKQEIVAKANKEILDVLDKYNLDMYLLLNLNKEKVIAMNLEFLKIFASKQF